MKDNNNNLQKKIVSIRKQLEEITENMKKIEDRIASNNIYFKDDLIEKTLFKMEKNVLDFRNIVPFFLKRNQVIMCKNRVFQNNFTQNYQIEISKNEYGYYIKLPLTLPKFGEKKKSILIEPLNFALKEYAQNKKIEQFKKAVFVVINCISSNTPTYLIRDNDNYEYKDIINTLSFWFLPDDSFDCCNLYSETQMCETNFTKIFIVPTEKFADFYLKHSKNLI